jgi:putative transposase
MAEALNGTFKAELVKLHGPWKIRAHLELAIIRWVDWYNETRLHGEFGDIPPAEHEAAWYRQQNAATTAA